MLTMVAGCVVTMAVMTPVALAVVGLAQAAAVGLARATMGEWWEAAAAWAEMGLPVVATWVA